MTFLLNRNVQLIIAVAALIGMAFWAYKGSISAAEKRGVKSVETAIALEVAEKTRVTNALTAEIRRLNDEKAHLIRNRADALRVRGAGKAACTNATSPGSGGRDSGSGSGTAPLPGMLDQPGVVLLGVPADAAIKNAEDADLNRNEVLSWREWYAKISAEWDKKSGRKK